MILVPWSTQLSYAKHGFDPWKRAWVLQGWDVLEDIAEEIPFISLSQEPFIFLLLFLWVSLNRNRGCSIIHMPQAILVPDLLKFSIVFKDLKHAIIGYIVLCPIGLSFFFFNVSKHSFMVVLLGKIQYYLKLLAKLNVFYIPESF